jgi:hypothetical protein
MGEGVQYYQKLRDVIYGRTRNDSKTFQNMKFQMFHCNLKWFEKIIMISFSFLFGTDTFFRARKKIS